ncbi:MAG: hypothetical protein RMM29_08960 [Planctomycetota bacterium]|nr:hypothetical protein [Planctomycetota bacterium]MCX8040380.1 hypothetical protein [Planctomycetota bacterium]MDW8373756.1 hypothetical protein [Planctomycetota bacterium]
MRRRRHGDDLTEGSVFPFISVLLCTMGAMVLVWVSFSLWASFSDPKHRAAADALEKQQAQLASELAQRRAALASLAELVAEHRERYGQLDALLAARRQELAKAQAEAEAIGASLQATRGRMDAAQRAEADLALLRHRLQLVQRLLEQEAQSARRAAELAGWQRQLAALSERERQLAALRADLERRRQRLAELGPQPVVVLRIPAAARWRPLPIEVAAQGLRAVPAEATAAPVPLAAAGARDGLLRQAALATADGSACVILLVRPDAIATHRQAAALLRDLRARFAVEPVEADWDLSRLQVVEE